ncbi:hypothetical protein DSCO28_64050 [Desulfosarcina ovata subsp. sediminis]|uniref:PBP domain-containing protein n=1 Tax=Desulfosarcina ovata subsp. sediminis TaxID=885957 RepID=A0A5K7ZZY6_9BACT|nr:hypothetical protein [Desulfosarcina ovata]BBO85839.1 hypothetical protein DSCO28_64050 [Desulfosarcina ovata subsp. sediminis]
MFKRIMKGAMIGAAALALSVPAQAADITVNLFGASAQYKFWTSAAPEFLASVCNGDVYHAKTTGMVGTDGERDTGIAYSTDCQGVGDNVTITYTTFSSQKGILAVSDQAGYDNCGTGKAEVADPSNVSATVYPAAAGTVDGLVCADIHIGASDVSGEAFGQESHGQLLGPNGGGWYDSYANPVDTTGLENCRPINVPFSFFAHQDTVVLDGLDLADETVHTYWGEFYPWWPVGDSKQNLTRLMATSLFSGQVLDWSDFGYPAQEVILCLRHAGSGTHATLDADIMRGEANLVKDEVLNTDDGYILGISPVTYFNKGSSDMMNCIRDAGAGAVGYADSDKNGGNPDGSAGSYTTVQRLKYMGKDAVAYTLIHGMYDFWSAQWLYFRADEDASIKAKINELCAFASDYLNMPSSRRAFWTTKGEMRVEKSSDFTWPSWKDPSLWTHPE